MTLGEGMSSGAPMEFVKHRVETHARETDLSMVYTIDPAVVDDYINSVEQLLARDKYKVVGIDLQYTTGRPDIDQKVAVTQLCVGHHVLIYHYCMATELATVSTGLSTTLTTSSSRWRPPTM